MANQFDELFNDLSKSKTVEAFFAWLEVPGNSEKLTRTLNVVLLGLMGRRAIRKGLVAAGLEAEKAKLIAKAIPWAAYLIASNATTGHHLAEDSYDDTYGELDDDEDA